MKWYEFVFFTILAIVSFSCSFASIIGPAAVGLIAGIMNSQHKELKLFVAAVIGIVLQSLIFLPFSEIFFAFLIINLASFSLLYLVGSFKKEERVLDLR